MLRLSLALLAIGLVSGAGAKEAAPKDVTVELPQSADLFPGGDKAGPVNANCLTCHSTEMVLMQPALTREEWAKEVAKMKKAYGAPVQDRDVPAIVDYLAALKPAR